MKEIKSDMSERYLAQWLEGELSDVELKNLVSDKDFLTYKKMKQGLLVLEKPDKDVFIAIQEEIDRKEPKVISMRKSTLWISAVAASVAVIFVGYLFFQNSTVTSTTTFAEQKTLTLLDGSQVVLNSKSSLQYDEKNWEADRTVILEGEAYFKVAKGSTFTVVTDDGNVEVLGTEFNVNEALDYFEVTCYEGLVSVEIDDIANVLEPGNSIRKINGDHVERGEVFVEEPSWVRGESTFDGVPLTYVINALERQYQVTFEAENIDFNARFTGSFTNNDLEVALATVFITMNIDYREKKPGNYILSDMNEK